MLIAASLEDVFDLLDDVVGEPHLIDPSFQPIIELVVGVDFLLAEEGHVVAHLVELYQRLEAMTNANGLLGLTHRQLVAAVLPGEIHVVEQMFEMLFWLSFPETLLPGIQIIEGLEYLVRTDDEFPNADCDIVPLDAHQALGENVQHAYRLESERLAFEGVLPIIRHLFL